MAPLPTRQALESMKRTDLQRICKEYGVKANLKSEALIDLLLETQSPRHPQHSLPQSEPQPSEPPPRRSVSTRQSNKAGPSRITSVIVHDLAQDDRTTQTGHKPIPEESPSDNPPPIPPPRTRKGKESQARLGVGRPVAAGGQGARSATRASGSLKRPRSSRTMRPRDTTIAEEMELSHDGPSSEHIVTRSSPAPSETRKSSIASTSELSQVLRSVMAPLEDQIRQLRIDLDRSRNVINNFGHLQTQLHELSVTQQAVNQRLDLLSDLPEQLAAVRSELEELRNPDDSSPRPSTPRQKTNHTALGFGLPSTFRGGPQPLPIFEPPGTPTQPHVDPFQRKRTLSSLGKRQRDPTQETNGGRTLRKRSRTQEPQAAGSSKTTMAVDGELSGEAPSGPPFQVFSDSQGTVDFLDSAAETLADLLDAHTPGAGPSNHHTRAASGGPITSTANAAENQNHPFNFSFLSSTPVAGPFPYPEAPSSPTPAHARPVGASRDQGRTDPFQDFGFPSPIRRRVVSVPGTEGLPRTINPAALSSDTEESPVRRGKRKARSSDASRTSATPDTSIDEMSGTGRRTMYGTELEGNTRFGDFGVEDIASGLWARF